MSVRKTFELMEMINIMEGKILAYQTIWMWELITVMLDEF